MNEELLKKARAAQSPEELLQLARENDIADFTEENANAYFEAMHRSGELSDDELEQAAGGCKRGGRTVVTILNSCKQLRPLQSRTWAAGFAQPEVLISAGECVV